jgi:hypothetical protein
MELLKGPSELPKLGLFASPEQERLVPGLARWNLKELFLTESASGLQPEAPPSLPL